MKYLEVRPDQVKGAIASLSMLTSVMMSLTSGNPVSANLDGALQQLVQQID